MKLWESYWCQRFDKFQVCCDISSCQGDGVSNREKLNFEKVFLSLFLPGAEGGRRWAISAIPMKNTENTNNNKKQKNTQNTKNRWQGKVLCRCEHMGSPIRRNNWRGEQKLLLMDFFLILKKWIFLILKKINSEKRVNKRVDNSYRLVNMGRKSCRLVPGSSHIL